MDGRGFTVSYLRIQGFCSCFCCCVFRLFEAQHELTAVLHILRGCGI